MVSHGLLGTSSAVEQYRSFDLPRLAALVWPYARGVDLSLGCDVVGWTLAFDDWFEHDTAEEVAVSTVVRELLDVLHLRSSTPTSSAPLVHGFADIWVRAQDGMPEWWRARAVHHWENYLCSNAHEAMAREHSRSPPELDEFLVLRRGTVCLENYLDLTERLGGFVLSPGTFHIPALRVMRDIAAHVPALTNDVVTLPKEEALGEVNNLVLVLERAGAQDRGAALEAARQMIDGLVNRFVDLTQGVPSMCDTYRLSGSERSAVGRYVEAQRLWMGGFEEWSQHTERYTNQSGLHPEAS